MSFEDQSFKLYTDAALTTLFSGLHQLSHRADLSDGNQDYQLWYGSTNDTRLLRTEVNPGVDNIQITPAEDLYPWVTATAYLVGQLREPTVQNGFKYRVKSITGSGVSGGTEPTWPTSGIGSTVIDGEVTWELYQATHEPTEAKLSLSAAGLDAATAGAALSLGTSISGGVANAIEINVRYTNTVTTIGSNTGQPELDFIINSVLETAV